MKILEQVKMRPFPAVRTTRKGSHTARAKQYHNNMNLLRALTKNKEEIIKGLIAGKIEIRFYFKMADGWSIKEKAQMKYQVHQQTPDIDNLYKAVTDTLFYGTEYNDSHISEIRCAKFWADEDIIEFNYFR